MPVLPFFPEEYEGLTMPPSRKKSHQLACIVVEKTVITDTLKHRFVIEKEFARGGFGRIYSGRQEDSKKFGKAGSLAIKIEPHANGPLFTEITVFQRILTPQKLEIWMDKKRVSHIGLPPYVSSGLFTYNGEKLRFLIMPRYEKSLETYRVANGGILDMHLVLTVAKQCVDCLSYMQDYDYVHADLKADNILLASANEYSRCFLVDFGLARLAKGNVDKPDKKRAHNGTLLFTSLDAHRGCAPSFRGDLEILGYNILYWLCGTLPWQKCEQKPEAVMVEKEKFSKQLDKNIKMLLQDGYVPFLCKLFKLAYETPYILNQIKTLPSSSKSSNLRSTKEKESAETSLISGKMNAKNISPSTSRKREGNTGGLGSSMLSGEPPSPKRRKSDRIANQLSKKVDDLPRISKEKSPGIGNNNSNKKKDIKNEPDVISHKKDFKKLKPRPRTSLKSIAKQNAPSSSASLFSSKKVEDSPGKKLRNVIPGLQNMKNVRRSLKDTLVKKYINVANQAKRKQ
uniref:non-specific serine/threonine protein kinase n=1 Tax=Loa loa TaxID=7209 RepID=A0A1I7VLN2_LOALO